MTKIVIEMILNFPDYVDAPSARDKAEDYLQTCEKIADLTGLFSVSGIADPMHQSMRGLVVDFIDTMPADLGDLESLSHGELVSRLAVFVGEARNRWADLGDG